MKNHFIQTSKIINDQLNDIKFIKLPLFILMCLLGTFSSIAQKKSLTKEETLSWLTDNAASFMPKKVFSGKEADCSIAITFEEEQMILHRFIWNKNGSLLYQNEIRLNYQNILLQTVNEIQTDSSTKWYGLEEQIVPAILIKAKYNSVFNQFITNGSSKGNDYQSSYLLMPFQTDINMPGTKNNVLHVIKAIMHLAELSGATPNKQIY